jgi:ribosome maturation factor RimP
MYLDAPGGVTLGDCEQVSREVAALLDVEDPISMPYQLEVSSPGLDRPLTKPVHFERFTGRKARVELETPINGQRRFLGVIAGVGPEVVRLSVDRGEVQLAFSAISRARLVPDYSSKHSSTRAEGEA